ncbi:MAG: hypothetical protein AB7O65_01415 [Candidatus Korobacteraceae bacterium]
MATNPRIPEQPHDPSPRDGTKLHIEESAKRRFPMPLIALAVAALILGALIWYLPQTPTAEPGPTGAAIPAQPTGGQIQLTDVNLATSPVGNQVYIDAVLHNTGDTAINGLLIDVAFPGNNGQTVATIRVPVTALQGESNTVATALTENPIAPNEAQPVRIAIPSTPQEWNRQLPGITVAMVTAVGAEGESVPSEQQPGTVVEEAPQAQE